MCVCVHDNISNVSSQVGGGGERYMCNKWKKHEASVHLRESETERETHIEFPPEMTQSSLSP